MKYLTTQYLEIPYNSGSLSLYEERKIRACIEEKKPEGFASTAGIPYSSQWKRSGREMGTYIIFLDVFTLVINS